MGYKGYPRAICISPNDVVVHGIPGPRLPSRRATSSPIDVGATLDGAIADSAYTFGVGSVDAESQRLLDVCQDALAAGISEARLGNRIGDISHAVQTVVEAAGFSVVRASSGTASAATTTRTRTCRTSASRGVGRGSRRA